MDCLHDKEYAKREAEREERRKQIASQKITVEGISVTLGDLFGADSYDAERFYDKVKLISLGKGEASSPTSASEPVDVEAELFGPTKED